MYGAQTKVARKSRVSLKPGKKSMKRHKGKKKRVAAIGSLYKESLKQNFDYKVEFRLQS